MDINYYNTKIDTFIGKYQNNAKQRSDEWYKLINNTVGGSDIATIIGKNKYKNKYQLALEKAGISEPFNGNFACWWGTVFEDIASRFIELDCMTKVKGTELTIQDIPYIRYSPDGYAVVKVHYDSKINNMYLINHDNILDHYNCPDCHYKIVLIEIKCPRSRKPVSGMIPEHYLPQLHSGLIFSPIADLGLFVENVIKVKSIKKLHQKKCIAYGVIGLYSTDISNDLIDVGELTIKQQEEYFRRICHHEYEFDFIDPELDTSSEIEIKLVIEELKNKKKHLSLIGYIPYIIESVHYTFVNRNVSFLTDSIDQILEFIDILKNLRKDNNYINKLIEQRDRNAEDDIVYIDDDTNMYSSIL